MNAGTNFQFQTIERCVVKIDPLVVSDRQKLTYTVVPGGNISAVRHVKCRPAPRQLHMISS